MSILRGLAFVALAVVVMTTALATAGSGASAAGSRSFIVVLKPGVDARGAARQHAQKYGLTVGFVYSHALRGYSAVIPAEALAAVTSDGNVAYLELDGEVTVPPEPEGASGAAEALAPADPSSCVLARTARADPSQLSACLQGRPGAGAQLGGLSSAEGSPGPATACSPAIGDDKCESWTAIYNGYSRGNPAAPAFSEFATDIETSPGGDRVYVTGVSWDPNDGGGNQTWATVAYDAATGARVWLARPFDQTGCGRGCSPNALAVSPDGRRLYVTGFTRDPAEIWADYEYTTIAYDTATGNEIWRRKYDGPAEFDQDIAMGVGVSPDGAQVYVTGYSWDYGPPGASDDTRTSDYATVAYDVSGRELWVDRYRGSAAGFDQAIALAVGSDGRIYVTGASTGARASYDDDVATLAYAPNGNRLWLARYDGGPGDSIDFGRGIAVSADGKRLFVGGPSSGDYSNIRSRVLDFEFATVAYDTTTGTQAWAERFRGASVPGHNSFQSIAAGTNDRVYVTGTVRVPNSRFPTDTSVAGPAGGTVAYDAGTGTLAWAQIYHSSGSAETYAVRASRDGRRVFVAGVNRDTAGNNAVTLAYDAASGGELWTARKVGAQAWRENTLVNHLSVAPDGSRVYSSGFFLEAGDMGFVTLAYDVAGGTAGPPPPPPQTPIVPPSQIVPWGIDRIDADLSSTHSGNGSGSVAGVTAYVIDTGIDTSHPDLNVVNHVNFAGGVNGDCNRHGTHVAGTIGARDNAGDVSGVAPGVPLVGVKVLDCRGSGTTASVIAGVDWVTANATKPAIANMSLGGSKSRALEQAVMASADSGIFYSVAAGNSAGSACLHSPAGAGLHDGVMTTAATDVADAEAWFSNYGPCVDIWAPGVRVLSTKLGGGTVVFSGTSMAAPHVGGTATLYLSSHPSASPAIVENALKLDAVGTGTTSRAGRAIKLVYARNY